MKFAFHLFFFCEQRLVALGTKLAVHHRLYVEMLSLTGTDERPSLRLISQP